MPNLTGNVLYSLLHMLGNWAGLQLHALKKSYLTSLTEVVHLENVKRIILI